ncbi:Uncharacterised protein [Klebsiella pneumoniae]|nr:Uncharacterised protein [Klebsiella pneumoniae]
MKFKSWKNKSRLNYFKSKHQLNTLKLKKKFESKLLMQCLIMKFLSTENFKSKNWRSIEKQCMSKPQYHNQMLLIY